jgi:alpha-aminoadipate/glutamate carrier protein LysW
METYIAAKYAGYNTACPECGAENVYQPGKDVIAGEIRDCPDCGVELEVIEIKKNVDGLEKLMLGLALAPEEKEDWGE